MARVKNENNESFNVNDDQSNPATGKVKKPARLMKATDFLKGGPDFGLDETTTADSPAPLDLNETSENELDYHVRAGRIGGQSTKQRHRDTNFYKEIGARGGTTTMARHGADYSERRKKGGETTRERYGESYYHNIAAKAARTKQDATRLRNDAIKALLNEGYKIPTIIKLTLDNLLDDERLQNLAKNSPLAEYLTERPESENRNLFLSQSGKPLSLANTYTVMERHKSSNEF